MKILLRACITAHGFFTLEILMFFPAFRARNTIFKGYFSFTTATKDSVIKGKNLRYLETKTIFMDFFFKIFRIFIQVG
jgi:hypothetical protein